MTLLRSMFHAVGSGLAWFALLGTLFGAAILASSSEQELPEKESSWRGPTALWLAPDGASLFAACSKSGSVVVLDTANRECIAELRIGKSLVAMAATPDGAKLAVCDAVANELLILDRAGRDLTLRARVPVPADPMSVVMDGEGRSCFVTSRWSRQLSRVDFDSERIISRVTLDFAPRNSILLRDGKTLVVSSAFGGELALVDTQSDRVIRDVKVPGHNMRGLALSPDGKELLVTHLIGTESAATTRDNIFWGIAMTSNMRVIPVSALFDQDKSPTREAHTHFFSDPGNAAGDPGTVATLSDGTTLICYEGVGEIAVGRYYPYGFRRIPVGQHPAAVAVSPDEKTIYVANSHSDSISVVRVAERANVGEIALGIRPGGQSGRQGEITSLRPLFTQYTPLTNSTLAEEGERLFYNARLSLDGWFSCHSCHTDGHSNGQKADTFGDGSYGASKAVLTLHGTSATEPWAWNGSKKQLEDQVRESLRMTMQPKSPPGERTVAALTAYLRTLEPLPVAEWQKADDSAIARGERVFSIRGCSNCHAPPTYTNSHVYDVGLDDGEGGNKLFNPPSLRGVAHNAPYFHDGRAKTLEDVFRVHQHRLRTAPSDEDLSDLVAFLKSL